MQSRRNFCFWGPNNVLYNNCRLATGFVESRNFLHQALMKILNEDGARNAEVVSYVDDIVYTSSLPLGDYIEGLIALLKNFISRG